MSLVSGASCIKFYRGRTDIIASGVGPYLTFYENEKVISRFLLFEKNMKISGILFHDAIACIYSENVLKIIGLSDNLFNIEEKQKFEFEDWILSAKFISNDTITIVLRHSQFINVDLSNGEIKTRYPKDWKIATAAYIIDCDNYIVADSFGTICFNMDKYFEKTTDYGTVFDIDYNQNTNEIITAHEFHVANLWKLNDSKLENIKCYKGYTSRVWGAKFLPIGPITYGEDGCIHLLDESETIFHLHRIKNITAFDSIGDEVVTSGQDGLIKQFKLYKHNEKPIVIQCNKNGKNSKDPKFPLSIALLKNGKGLYGTVDGSVYMLPDDQPLINGNENIHGWYLIQTFGNLAFGASRSKHHFFYDGESVKIFEQTESTCISLTLNDKYLVDVYNNNILSIKTLNSEKVLDMSISDYFLKTPTAISIHPSKPIIGLGSHASKIVILDFEDNFSALKSASVLTSSSNDGFRSITFSDSLLYCAGRTDGLVTIIGKMENKWCLKSIWRIPNQCRSTSHIQCVDNKELVSVTTMMKDSIGIWDINSQTMADKFKIPNQHNNFIITLNDESSYSIAWVSEGSIKFYSKLQCIPLKSFGSAFHGLRGLCLSRYNNLIASGSCDRDIRLWKIIDGDIRCIDLVQSIDFGTHAICFNKKDSLMFSGGSKGYLYIWKLFNERLFRLNSFPIGDNSNKYQLRITSLTVNNENKLLVGLSDASIRIYTYDEKLNELTFIEKITLNGVPVSSFNLGDIFSIATSTGHVYWYRNEFSESKALDRTGILNIKMFNYNEKLFTVISGEDSVKIFEITEPFDVIERLTITGGHTGGIKAISLKAEEGYLFLLTFSYDQNANVYKISPQNLTIESQYHTTTPVTDGESAEFLDDGFVVFGSSIYYDK